LFLAVIPVLLQVVAVLPLLLSLRHHHAIAHAESIVENDGQTEGTLKECDITLTYEVGGLNETTFEANFILRNNSPHELSAWNVFWKYEAEEVIPESVEGAVLLEDEVDAIGRMGEFNVTNTEENAPIPPFSTTSFSLLAETTLAVENRANVSRAPNTIRVNGLHCQQILTADRPGHHEGYLEYIRFQERQCLSPAELGEEDITIRVAHTCQANYCCCEIGKVGQYCNDR
jgi:hypothetical protein